MKQNNEVILGRIIAIMNAAEDVIERAKACNDVSTIMMAKDTAFDHVSGILKDPAYCPWQE